MTTEHWPVEAEILVRIVEPAPLPLRTRWLYTPSDPFAVHVDFGEARWAFARELLARGLRQPSGLGDVMMWPDGRRVCVAMESDDGRMGFTARQRDLAEFLATTYRWVPWGEEPAFLDLDATVDRLLAGGASC